MFQQASAGKEEAAVARLPRVQARPGYDVVQTGYAGAHGAADPASQARKPGNACALHPNTNERRFGCNGKVRAVDGLTKTGRSRNPRRERQNIPEAGENMVAAVGERAAYAGAAKAKG
jgi:hypothetical protein